MKIRFFIPFLFLLSPPLNALDISTWTNLSGVPASGQNLLINPGFEDGAEGWTVDPNAAEVGRFGSAGSQGMRLQWKDRNPSSTVLQQKLKLKPNCSYTLSLVLNVNKKAVANSSRVRIYFNARTPGANEPTFSNSKGINTFKGEPGAWRTVEMKLNTNGAKGDLEGEIGAFFGQTSQGGELDIDDFSLVEDAPTWRPWLTQPRRTWVDTAGETVEFGSYLSGFHYPGMERADYRCLVQVDHPEIKEPATFVALVKNNRFKIDLGAMPEGNITVKFTLVDAANQVVLQKGEIPLAVRPRPESMVVEVDELGRTLVKGKPFLPVGIFTSSLGQKVLTTLKETPFNTVLPYGSLSMKLPGDRTGVKAIRKVLDLAEDQNLKVIFSLKSMYPNIRYSVKEWAGLKDRSQIMDAVTTGLRDHPALLAWYTADELGTRSAKPIEDWRRVINLNDPGRPVLAIYNRPNTFPALAMGQDIFGIDPYPISDKNSRDMDMVREHLQEAQHYTANSEGKAPTYLVAQLFNRGRFNILTRNDLEAYNALYRDPTEHEILSMLLLGAIKGAKGFFFYSLQDIDNSRPPERRGPDPDHYTRRWPGICRVAGQIRELEPYILSTQPAPKFEMEVRQGKVEAQTMKTEDGRSILLIAGIGPGPAEAVITFPSGSGLQSQTGKTIAEGERYHFTGNDICCDILK